MAGPDTPRRGRDDQRPDTTLITSGRADGHPALAPTLYPTTTFVTQSVEEGRRMATDPDEDRFYTRYGNPTGAGDALAAGLVVGYLRGFPAAEMVRLGVAAAVASLAQGYGRFRAKDVRPEAVVFEALD